MRLILSLMAVGTMAIFVACQTASSSTIDTAKTVETKNEKTEKVSYESKDTDTTEDAHAHDGDEVERITIEEAKKLFDAGDAIIVDARSNNAYNNEHIKGSINIPANEFEKRYKEVPKDKKIIVYCS